jgi:hypothetical protein
MYWDVDVFGELQRSYPEEDAPLAYAALNACISSSSLENWVKSAWKRQRRIEGRNIDSDDFSSLLRINIPYQDLCVDVANTTKHGEFRDSRWKNGELKLEYDDESEDTPSGFSIKALHEGRISYLYNDIHDLPHRWWNLLLEIDLVSCEMPTPDWFRRKWRL